MRRSPLVSTAPSLRERLRRVRMDVTPLRESRDFRLLFSAGTVFYLGGMVSYVAIGRPNWFSFSVPSGCSLFRPIENSWRISRG